VAVFGTPAFAVPTLESLLGSSHRVVAAITQPDRPRGRGQQVSSGPMKALAIARGLPVLQPERLKRELFETEFDALGVDIAVVAAYGKLLPAWLLAKPRLGFVNVHASLLPKYRGASPVHHAVMAGDAETGVTIMRVVEALDAGPMLAKRTLAIGPDDRTDEVEPALAALGAGLVVETLDRMALGPVTETPQDDSQATYARRLTKADGVIDWSRPARDIHNQVRGLTPWPLAHSFVNGLRVIVRRSRRLTDRSGVEGDPGTIVRLPSGGVGVVAGDREVLEILQLQPEGKRVMSGHDALAGRVVGPGDRFDR
jgi:methionyl-tRNA formyltransferase